jgi:methyl-accepting chemotaxis protein
MKFFKSLRVQFVGLFTLFIIVIASTSAVLGVRQMAKTAVETFSITGISIVEKAASVINGDSFEALSKSLKAGDPYYEKARLQLLQIKEYSGCQYLYTMAPARGNVWHYIIDGSVPPDDENFSALGDEEDIADYDDAFKKTIVSGKTEIGNLVFQEDWGWLVSIYTPITNSAGKIVGIVGCDYNGAYLHDAITEHTMVQCVIGGISIAIGLALLLFFLRKFFLPLDKFNVILKEISLGEGDITKRVKNYSDDEIGHLAGYFNSTLDKIKNLIFSIKGETANLLNVGDNLAAGMQQTAGAINQITATLQIIKQKITNQSASVFETRTTMEQVTANIDKLNKNVEAQTESVTQSSSAIEKMLANIQNVTRTLINNEKNVQELTEVSDAGRNSLQKVTQDIQGIARESEGLLAINAVMENIASQTNLLSMNAAIEAAHAGEAGKGFAVVAGEIRKLAVNSSEQSRTISDVLKRIKTSIDTINGSTNTALEKFSAIEDRVDVVSAQETNIRNAMEEQGQGSQQILEAVARMNELTLMVKQSSQSMMEGSKEVIMESKTLETVTEEISYGMNEMAGSAEQINKAVNQINETSKSNKDHISSLFAEVSKFKID